MQALTTTDAFFVAYQEQAGISMHFGSELDVLGELDREVVTRAIGHVLRRWPALGQQLARGLGGLRWRGGPHAVLTEASDVAEVTRWRNLPIDPFREAPFGVLWVRDAGRHRFALRCHHAVADGELFLAITHELLRALAAARAEPHRAVADGRSPADVARPHPLGLARLWTIAKLTPSVRYARQLARDARADRAAHVALREVTPGPIAILDRRLPAAACEALRVRARQARVRPAWLVAAAWLESLYAWNARHGRDRAELSLEVPVSLRRGSSGTGNHLAVLTLYADARQPLDERARALWHAYAAGVRRRNHLAIPLLASPARLLPWPLFRKVAVTPTSTGVATSHFTWLSPAPEVHARFAERSASALQLADQRFYTPVCLRMGAALCAVPWERELQLSITHRLTGLSSQDAAALGDVLVATLS